MKIKDLIGDLTYKEIKDRRWRTPRLWRNEKKILFTDYIISKDGVIIRIVKRSNSKIGKKIKTRNNFKEYIIVNLCRGKKKNRVGAIFLHRLLWETWRGKIPEGLEINHKYGIKSNNNLKDLEVVTRLENIKHSKKIGLNWTKEWKRRMSKRYKGKSWEETYGKKTANMMKKNMSKVHTGKKLSKRHREIISKVNKERVFSKEHKRNISKALIGRVFSEEHKKNISKAKILFHKNREKKYGTN